MGSREHSHDRLVHDAIARAVDNHVRNGGVVPATTESKRLAATYPACGLSSIEIRALLADRARAHGLMTDDGEPHLAAFRLADGAGSPQG